MVLTAEPAHLEGLVVVVVMLLDALGGTALLARPRNQEAALLVFFGVCPRISLLALLIGQLTVPWAMLTLVRSVAGAAVSLPWAISFATTFGTLHQEAPEVT